MTSQKDQIQRLIAEIEATLAKPSARLPLGLSGEAERQRQLLGKLFSYLQSLQQMFDSPGGWGPIDPGTGQFVSPQVAPTDVEESASQVLQGLLLEMRYLRENSLKPMRQELESLQQKRDSLQAEVNVLEGQRSSGSLRSEQQIADFLEVLMQRLQEQLSAQMVQNFATMEAATVEQLAAADNPMPLLSGQRLEQVKLLQAQSDQLLLKLDSTLTAVFDSLQKSVDSYRESLEEGLDQMHGLGRQGEVIFHAFINHLAQQLGQDASSYLTGDLGAAVQRAVLEQPDGADVDVGPVPRDELDQALDDLSLDADAGEEMVDPGLAVDPDLALLEDEIAPLDDDDITLIQNVDLPDTAAALAELENEIAPVDEDEDITLIQVDGDLAPVVDLDEDITLIQPDDDPVLEVEPELAFLEESISDIDLDELSAAIGTDPEMDMAAIEEDTTVASDADDEVSEADPAVPDLDEFSASFSLDSALGAIDESLGLLAIGADEGDLSDLIQSADDDPSNPEQLPQVETEGELFNLDADNDATSDADENKVVFFEPVEVGTDEAPRYEPDILMVESDLVDATQVADNWLFDRGPAETLGDAADGPAMAIGSSDISGDVIADDDDSFADITVENLFGDPLVADEEDVDDQPRETVSSLSELLPDEQSLEAVEEFPENVPDDVYIAASADEDLINLVESSAEQRLLIDFDDGELVEQLDEDLQKLAGGDTFVADYGVEEEVVLEPLDQVTLENIVNDLNLEDLNLDEELQGEVSLDLDEAGGIGDQPVAELDQASELIDAVEEPSQDLFAEFPEETVDIDNPSEEEEISPAINDGEDEADLDLLGLVIDPLEPLENDFDDGLPDSLADELGGLSERSNVLSQEPTEEVMGQLLSDLEEPVIIDDENIVVPAVDETEPHLDSASIPDVPLDEIDVDSPVADDFLQAEQEAFWRTMSDAGEQTATIANADLGATNAGSVDADAEIAIDLSLEAVSADLADDIDDLLLLDSPPASEGDIADETELDLGDLDDLFGESALADLEELDPPGPSRLEDAQAIDPLAELDLEGAIDSEADGGVAQMPPFQMPDVEVPDVEVPESFLPESFLEEDASAVDPALLENPSVVDPELSDEVVEEEVRAAVPVAPVPPTTMPAAPAVDLTGDWFFGLDVGATGLSAVLMNRQTGQVYPLYWQTAADETKHFRLPAMAVMTSAQDTVAVGYDALGDIEEMLDVSGASLLVGVNRLKPLLKVAVGHGQTLPDSDPWLRWSETVELPMLQVLQAMVALLKYLMERGQAVGLEGDSLTQVWERLQGVVVGYPTNWPDTYSFNLREAVLAAGLVEQPERVLFVEDAIATVLSGLPDPNDISLSDTVSLSRQPSLYNCQWQEGTVVISGGAVMTELGLVNLPSDLTKLNYGDFALRGFAYAGDALDQDIVCQLLLPEERRQPLSDTDAGINWDWQGHLSGAEADWRQLNLDNLTLPTVGHVDWAQRYRLQQRLLGSNLGQSLLAAARHLKLALQQQNHMQITLAGQRWLIKRRHLENLIFLPYIQRINRYLNVLLSHNSVDAQSIKQVVCTGGSASLPAIARWLRQKFPNATIIQDTYASELPQSCSRVAYGLVNLARYGQVLNVTRQQYSDYFLLMELLRVFPQQPLPVGAIMHLLEQRGINTQACHLHILALLEGHLPPGLVPTAADRGLICDRTTDLPIYRALLQTPLFSKTVTESGGHIYIPNEAQAEQLRAYVNRLLVGKVQRLEEPLIAQLEVFA
ncbi:MAG: hypothetical protein AAF579_04215 [Cyanobacteria bacterium P01_C01_bin.118]